MQSLVQFWNSHSTCDFGTNPSKHSQIGLLLIMQMQLVITTQKVLFDSLQLTLLNTFE